MISTPGSRGVPLVFGKLQVKPANLQAKEPRRASGYMKAFKLLQIPHIHSEPIPLQQNVAIGCPLDVEFRRDGLSV